MSAAILRFPAEPPVDRQLEISAAQRAWLVVEDALAGTWSDSNLIAGLAYADRLERQRILAELEARAGSTRRCPL